MKDLRHIEPYRVATGPLASTKDELPGAGMFTLPLKPGYLAICLASDGKHMIEETGWEHVSVHVRFEYGRKVKGRRKTKARLPNQEEIYLVKNVFWDPYEPVVQYYDKESVEVDDYKANVHLWLPVEDAQPRPPSTLFASTLNYIRSASGPEPETDEEESPESPESPESSE